jgi:ABC-type nitrate/sulfonate/bicarbonate transport system ATPase subunit
MILLEQVGFAYPDGPLVFDGFDWQVDSGEAWAVLGPSGCGKSTLLYLLAGLRRPTAGRVVVDDIQLLKPRPRTGLILQDYGLLPWATVRDNIALGLRLRRFYGPDGVHAPRDERVVAIEGKVESWMARLDLMPVAGSYPGQISGGQRQRTAIARTLALDPDLLLMDEPFASLDAPTREGLQSLAIELHQERKLTTIIVTHAIEEAALLGHKVLLLARPPLSTGRIFDNPGTSRAGWRDSPAYNALCAELRQAMEGLP